MRDYIRCVVANKATLSTFVIVLCVIAVGLFILIVLGPTSTLYSITSFWVLYVIGWSSAGVSGYTQFGYGTTYSAYKRTRAHIQEHGGVDKRFASSIQPAYCYRVGFELAVKRAGIIVSP